ncbi:hypothetical protein SLS62_011450, partial [Diatrype stigma]
MRCAASGQSRAAVTAAGADSPWNAEKSRRLLRGVPDGREVAMPPLAAGPASDLRRCRLRIVDDREGVALRL